MSPRQKKLEYLVLGVIIGTASVVAAGAYSGTESTTTDASTIAAMIKPAESVCQELVVVKELELPGFAPPVRLATPMPPLIAAKNVVVKAKTLEEDVRKVHQVGEFPKKSMNYAAVCASGGRVAGLIIAPMVVWSTSPVQNLPGLTTAIPGGWGVAAFVGSVVIQGIIQLSMLRHVN